MALYLVKFYNRASEWFHSEMIVDAVTEGTAEIEARNEFGPDESYYRTGIEEITQDVPAPAVDTQETEPANG